MPQSDSLPDDNRQEAQSGAQGEEFFEGGYVRPLEDYFVKEKHRADTARRLAYSLVAILGGTVFLHYLSVLTLEIKGRSAAVQSLSQIFNVWLPVIASLVSSAVTYYFAKEE
jgi:hypothetical protein